MSSLQVLVISNDLNVQQLRSEQNVSVRKDRDVRKKLHLNLKEEASWVLVFISTTSKLFHTIHSVRWKVEERQNTWFAFWALQTPLLTTRIIQDSVVLFHTTSYYELVNENWLHKAMPTNRMAQSHIKQSTQSVENIWTISKHITNDETVTDVLALDKVMQ